MKIHNGIKLYLDTIKIDVSEGTQACYRNHLNYFEKWCDSNKIKSFSDLKKKQIHKFTEYMRNTCCSVTINKRFRIIKRLNKVLEIGNKHIAVIPNYKEQRKVFEMFELEDLQKIREHIKSDFMKEPNALMYQLLFLILMDTGIRRTELLDIKIFNIDMKHHEIKLEHTKTGEERIVYFSEVTARYIQLQIDQKVNHDYLMHNQLRNRPMNQYDIDYIIKKYKKKFNMKHFHPHMFRHSFVTIWLQNGATQKEVKEVTGIKTPEVLDRYWHIAKNEVKKSYDVNYKLD